jgi:hypothetical protein
VGRLVAIAPSPQQFRDFPGIGVISGCEKQHTTAMDAFRLPFRLYGRGRKPMKISNAVTIALLLAAKAGQTKPTTPLASKVIICLEYGNDLSVTYRAQIMASRMFAAIDVAT